MITAISPDEAGRVIHQTMTGILGDLASAFFFKILKRKTQITSSEITTNPEAFSTLLRDLFGSGVTAIERSIVHELSRQFDPRLSTKEFLEAIDELSNRA